MLQRYDQIVPELRESQWNYVLQIKDFSLRATAFCFFERERERVRVRYVQYDLSSIKQEWEGKKKACLRAMSLVSGQVLWRKTPRSASKTKTQWNRSNQKQAGLKEVLFEVTRGFKAWKAVADLGCFRGIGKK